MPAIAQDPLTGDLLLCDAITGDILRCNPVTMVCRIEVERTLLRTSDGIEVMGEAGLPATNLALNEQQLYTGHVQTLRVCMLSTCQQEAR